jgi:D-alanine-D-alanine ligase
MIVGLTYDLRKDYEELGYSQQAVAEFDSEETISFIESAIQSLGYKTARIGNVFSLCKKLAAGEKWDLVFNIAEGLAGRSREAQVPAMLEAYSIPYAMSDPLVCALTLDKAMTKRILQSAGLATPKFAVIESAKDIAGISLRYPLFAKPNAEGTGKGIDEKSKIENPKQLKALCENLLGQFNQPVLVEEFLPGREFTTGLLGTGKDAYVLGTMEIVMRTRTDGNIYSYDAKERCEHLIDYVRFDEKPLADKIAALALAAYKVLECRDTGRIDIRCDAAGEPCFIEINPLPGMHPTHSDLPMIATREGMSYKELVAAIINSALKRTRN